MNQITVDYSGKAAMQAIITTAITVALIALFAYALNVGMNRQEVVDCNTWQSQAAQYPAFFLTKWQDQQCRAHGIIIQAPVK